MTELNEYGYLVQRKPNIPKPTFVNIPVNNIDSISSIDSRGHIFEEHRGPSQFVLADSITLGNYIEYYVTHIIIKNINHTPITNPIFGKIEFIGKGRTGRVFKIKIGTNEYVLKIIKYENNKDRDNAVNEIEKLKLVKGKSWAVQLLAAQFNYRNKFVFLLYPYIPGDTLDNITEKLIIEYNAPSTTDERRKEIEEHLKKIFNRILHALDELHKLKITHNDIKFENIWIMEDNNEPILLDFDISHNIGTTIGICGTVYFMNPKLNNLSKASPNRNYYALGKMADSSTILSKSPIISTLLQNGINSATLGSQKFGGKKIIYFNYHRKKYTARRRRGHRTKRTHHKNN
jgi:serine/threonine protein kinase